MEKSGNISAETGSETIGAVVAKNYRAADVFEKYGIDFCCGGNVPVAQACKDRGIDPEALRRELERATAEPLTSSVNFDAWELPTLADYIVDTHHVYLKQNTAAIIAYTEKVAQVHGAHHPEVIEIASIFGRLAADITLHAAKEEDLLFPAIHRLVALKDAGGNPETGDVERLRAVLAELLHEHDEVGAAIHEIRRLARDYQVPADACNTFTVTYQKLKEYEDDLHKHVHLENNILFPKATKL